MNPRNENTKLENVKPALFLWMGIFILATFVAPVRARATSVVDLIEKDGGAESALEKNTYGVDNRQLVNSSSFPWSTVGKLVNASGASCTGTLVGEALVLTAAHCVLENGQLTSLTFYPNQINGQALTSSPAVQTSFGTNDPQTNRTSDWAIIILRDRLGLTYGFMGVSDTTSAAFPSGFIVAGYSYEFASGNTASASLGHNRGDHNGLVFHDAHTAMGSSGGPVFSTVDGTNLSVVGVNVAEMRRGGNESLHLAYYDDLVANVAIPTNGLMSTLRSLKAQGY